MMKLGEIRDARGEVHFDDDADSDVPFHLRATGQLAFLGFEEDGDPLWEVTFLAIDIHDSEGQKIGTIFHPTEDIADLIRKALIANVSTS